MYSAIPRVRFTFGCTRLEPADFRTIPLEISAQNRDGTYVRYNFKGEWT